MVVGCWKALAISRVRSIDVNEAVDVSDHEPVAIERTPPTRTVLRDGW